MPGGPARRIAGADYRPVIPAAEVRDFLGPRAAALLGLYSECHVEAVAGLGGVFERGVSLVEREKLYRALGIGRGSAAAEPAVVVAESDGTDRSVASVWPWRSRRASRAEIQEQLDRLREKDMDPVARAAAQLARDLAAAEEAARGADFRNLPALLKAIEEAAARAEKERIAADAAAEASRRAGIEALVQDEYLRDLISRAFATITQARSEGQSGGGEERRKRDEEKRKK